MDYMSINEAAEKWGISERRIQKMCEENRVSSSMRFSRVWAIPLILFQRIFGGIVIIVKLNIL